MLFGWQNYLREGECHVYIAIDSEIVLHNEWDHLYGVV